MEDLLLTLKQNRSLFSCCGVYAFFFRYKGEQSSYIGSSKMMYHRLREEIRDLRKNKHHNWHLQGIWNKVGEDAFVLAILERCPEYIRFDFEQECIDLNNNVNLAKKVNYLPKHQSGLKGLTYLEIHGTSTPPNGFKSGEENIAKQSDVRKLISENTKKMWETGLLKPIKPTSEVKKRRAEGRKVAWNKNHELRIRKIKTALLKRKRTRLRICYCCFHPFDPKHETNRITCSSKCGQTVRHMINRETRESRGTS